MANTVKVRIAVAVDENGKWAAYGLHNYDDRVNQNSLSTLGFLNPSICYVEAELPIPEIQTIQAKVSE